jgi:hypothetical protein
MNASAATSLLFVFKGSGYPDTRPGPALAGSGYLGYLGWK